ncbi:MAG: CCA tRNA nucleotidyltransferase [Anaerolineales bacterium]
MPGEPELRAYAGYWVALVRGRVVGVGRTEEEAYRAAKAARRREEPQVVYVPPDAADSRGAQDGRRSSHGRVADSVAQYGAAQDAIQRVAELVGQWEPSAFLVGGSVRDLLLGRAVHDIDIVVPRDALALGRRVADALGGAFYPLDEQRDVARVLFSWHGTPFSLDVAALRGPDLEADLRARDFTVNAMAMPLGDLRREAIVDPTGGLADLTAGVLRPVSGDVFRDDPVRTLRVVRFVHELGLMAAPGLEQAVAAHAPLLAQVASERVRDEVNRMAALPAFGACLRDMDRLGLLDVFLPELAGLRGVAQPLPHRWDALEHSLRTVEAVEALAGAEAGGPWGDFAAALGPLRQDVADYLAVSVAPGESRLALLKLAAALHDVGKPATRTEEGGRVRFYNHPQVGADMAAQALTRLRYSAAAVALVSGVVREHMWLLSLVRTRSVTNRALYRFHRALGDGAVAAALLFLGDLFATQPVEQDPNWPAAQAIVQRVLQACLREPHIVSPQPVVSGRDLMTALNLGEGPIIGTLLEAIREAQAEGKVATRDDALALAARMVGKQQRMRRDGDR